MKCFLIVAGAFGLSLFPATASTAAPSASSLQQKVADAEKDLKRAQSRFEAAKEKACADLSDGDKAVWQQAEAPFESLLQTGAGPETIKAQKASVEEIEARVMKPEDRERIDAARNKVITAQAALDKARARLAADTRGTNNHDDSSQATQPENPTQNGSGFSVRSERDAENHPPLPAGQ